MFVPLNEMGVVVLFTEVCERLGWKIVNVQQNYPDAIIEDLKTGDQFYAEFEFMASNYIQHKHDPRICDLIICWENDFHDSLLPVLSLCEFENGFTFRPVSTIKKVKMHNMLQDGLLSKDKKVTEKVTSEDEEIQKSIVSHMPNGRLVVSTKVIFDPNIDKDPHVACMIEDTPPDKLSKIIRTILFKGLKNKADDYGIDHWGSFDDEEDGEDKEEEESEE